LKELFHGSSEEIFVFHKQNILLLQPKPWSKIDTCIMHYEMQYVDEYINIPLVSI
jgi:hypothetical protein